MKINLRIKWEAILIVGCWRFETVLVFVGVQKTVAVSIQGSGRS
jgi:hypothetical protein